MSSAQFRDGPVKFRYEFIKDNEGKTFPGLAAYRTGRLERAQELLAEGSEEQTAQIRADYKTLVEEVHKVFGTPLQPFVNFYAQAEKIQDSKDKQRESPRTAQKRQEHPSAVFSETQRTGPH